MGRSATAKKKTNIYIYILQAKYLYYSQGYVFYFKGLLMEKYIHAFFISAFCIATLKQKFLPSGPDYSSTTNSSVK